MNNVSGFLLLLWIYSVQAFALDVQPLYQVATKDTITAESTYIEVVLTHDIYRYSTYADLRNLVVVDAEHNPLPFHFVDHVSEEATKKNILDIPFFPVSTNITPSDMRLLHNAQINVADNNVQIDIKDASTAVKQEKDFYLIDVSHLNQDISALQIDWQPSTKNQYLEVDLEASRNLQEWYPLGRHTLVQLQQDQQGVKRNRVHLSLPKSTYEFVRLRIIQTAEPIQITHVQAEFVDPLPISEGERWAVPGHLSKRQSNLNTGDSYPHKGVVSAWEFVRDEFTPANKVALNLGEHNYGDTIRVLSRADEKQPWTLQFEGVWFNAQVGNQWKSSDAIALYRNSDALWRVELTGFSFDRLIPELVFEWRPLHMHIITNNKSPYVVAVEQQANARKYQQIFDQLMVSPAPTWNKGDLLPLGARPALSNKPKDTLEWKRICFWVVLIVAVLLLLGFAIKLSRQFVKDTGGTA